MPPQNFYEAESLKCMNKINYDCFIMKYHNEIRAEYIKFRKQHSRRFPLLGNSTKEDHEVFYQNLVSLHQMEKLYRNKVISYRQKRQHYATICNACYRGSGSSVKWDTSIRQTYSHYINSTPEYKEKEFYPLQKVYFEARIWEEEKRARELVGDKVIKEYINKQKQAFAKCCKKLQIGNTQLPEVLEEKILEYVADYPISIF